MVPAWEPAVPVSSPVSLFSFGVEIGAAEIFLHTYWLLVFAPNGHILRGYKKGLRPQRFSRVLELVFDNLLSLLPLPSVL
jgi:hypothetical protein